MDDELVLLTSYFNLVDGRRQDATDTFRVDTHLPSAGSPDGGAALYIVTEASTSGHMGPRARRLAADTVAWEYASHGDEAPPARLKSALHSAHAEILREFDGHVAVGVTVMAVERDTVFLAQVAPSQVYVLHQGSLHSIPAAAEGATPFDRAIGARGTPAISIFRDQVEQGDVICLCSTWYDRSAEAADLRDCFGAGTSDEIAECLLDLAQQNDVRDATAIVIEAALSGELEVVPTGDEPPSFMEQVDIAVQALANVGRMLLSELQPAPSNGHSAEAVEAPTETVTAQRGSSSITSEVPLVPSEAAEPTVPLPETSAPPASDGWEAGQQVLEAPPKPEPLPEFDPSWEPPAASRADASAEPAVAENRLREDLTEEVPVVPPPQERSGSVPVPRPERSGSIPVPRPETPPLEPAPTEQTPAPVEETAKSARHDVEDVIAPSAKVEGPSLSEIEQVNSRIQHDADMGDVIPPVQAFEEASTEPARIYATSKDIQAVNRRPRRFAGTSVPVIRPGLADIDLRQPVSRPTPPAVIWASLAALLLVGAIAFGLYVKRHVGTHALPPYQSYVTSDLAHAKNAQTPAKQDHYLSLAKKNIDLAEHAGLPAKNIAAMRTSWLSTSDSLHHITRESTPTLLTDFAKFPGSQPSAIAVAPGVVYVVDTKRKGLFSVAATPNANPTEVVQAGDTYSGFTVGVPQLVATDGSTALVLDDKDVLVRDAAGTKTATSLTPQTQTPQHYVAMAASDPDVYLLDTAGSQVWRYPYAVSGYNLTQAAYWDTNPPKLNDGKSLAFDKTDLYILKGDGTVLKFDFQATPQKFTMNLTTPIRQPTALYTDAGQQWVWIADPTHKRIVQLDKNGGYSRTYLSSSSGMDFGTIQSLSVGPDGKTIYVLAGSKLYDFPVAS